MKQFIFFLVLVSLSSCKFYTSDVPISGSDKSVIDQKLLGKWYGADVDKENSNILKKTDEYVELLDFNAREYAFTLTSPEGSMLFRMHNSQVKDLRIFNIYPVNNDKEDDPVWFFCHIDDVSNDMLNLSYISDSLKEKFSKSKDLEKFLTKNIVKLKKEWMSEPVKFYREEFFLWDRVNTLKTADLEEVSRIDASYPEIADKTAAQLSIMSKKTMDKAVTAYFISNAYQSAKPLNFNPIYSLLIKFQNGTMKILDFNSSESTFFDRSNGKYYKVKDGVKMDKK
jgi:hypothetical protein